MPEIEKGEIDHALEKWAEHIASSHAREETLGLVGLVSHGDVLAQRLTRILREKGFRKIQCGAIDVTLYRDDIDLRQARLALRSSDLPFSTDGMPLILVDDVVQSGRTARAALDAIFEYGRPERVELHCLVEREGRQLPIHPDYAAFRLTEEGAGDTVRVLLTEEDGKDIIEY